MGYASAVTVDMPFQTRDSRRGLSRRECIGVIGATSVSPFLSEKVTASGGEYANVVDIVEAGADNSGEVPIDDVFEEHATDDTLVRFPEGVYRVNHLSLYDLTHFAMVGNDATLVPGDDYDRDWITGMAERDVRIENFTIDTTGDGVGPQIDVSADDELLVRNIYKKGTHDGAGVGFGFHTNTEGGTAMLENIRAPDGGECVGIYIQSEGPVTVRNCHLEEFENNGLYASAGSGPVRVEGGTYRNNNVAQVRLGSPESYVRGAEIGVDKQVPADRDVVNMRGIRIADGPGPVTVEGCEISMTNSEGSGAVVGAYSGGSFQVLDTRIYVGEEYTTIGSDGSRTSYGIFADNATVVAPGQRTIERTSITGGGTFRGAMLFRRGNNTVRDCCIQQSGTGRNGIIFEESTDNTVADTTVDVTDEAFVLRDSTVRKSGISTDGVCPGIDDSPSSGELGRVETAQPDPEGWHTVGLEHRYDSPVVVGGPLSHDGSHPCHLRLRDVAADGFAFRLEEWMYLDGTHGTERADYLVVDAGTYRADDLTLEAGHVEIDHWFRPIEFDQAFERPPVVFTQPLTYNGPNPIVTRLRDVSTDGAYVLLQEEEGEENNGAHRTETVGYVAVEPGTGTLFGQPCEVGCCLEVDEDWQRIDFRETYDDPRCLAHVQTYNGANTANLRYRNLDETGVEVFVEEERSADDEVGHVSERVGVLVVDGS